MSIFKIFKKKDDAPEAPAASSGRSSKSSSGEKSSSRSGESSRLSVDTEAERQRQREIARATAMKIDAIESAMTFDIFNTPEPAWGSGPKRPGRAANTKTADTDNPDTLPMLELATTELLADEDRPAGLARPEVAPVIEEAAIMFANGHLPAAEAMLIDSLGDIGQRDRTVWWMLFDLYQTGGKQDAFDNLSIDYASRFETSPPAWVAPAPVTEEKAYTGLTPSEAFVGVLDQNIGPQLERLLQLAATSAVFRLEFARISDVTPEGCALLLDALGRLRALERELIVAGALELSQCIRTTIEIGRRDENQAPWLLLLELLQLMRLEKEFEETAMDYCVTYEVSPPSYAVPEHVATAASGRAPSSPDRFMLPPVVDSASAALLSAIDEYAAEHDPLVFDCLRLTRVEFNAATALLEHLRPLVAADKKVEFREMNHMVAALFQLLGYGEVVRLFPHKY